jgi:predicted secreted hydrolase
MSPPAFLSLSRRSLLLTALAAAVPASWALPARALQFPRDFGSHPELQTEWWYITGHAKTPAGREFGFQVTFFRSRVDAAQGLRSAFAAKHLVFAHAAVTDLDGRVLLHDQRIARAGFGIASASETDTDLRLRDWSLVRGADGSYSAHIPAGEFSIDLRFAPTQPLLLQGKAGLSRKGPEETQASYYYSEPQLKTQGRLTLKKGQAFDVDGTAWLDHEWSEALMHPDAVGWDWIGMNLDDGSALTAFRLRRRDGGALWAGGSFRTRDGALRIFGSDAATAAIAQLGAAGYTNEQALGTINRLVDQQAYTLAANDLFLLSAGVFLLLIGMLWSTRPKRGVVVDAAAAH